MPVIGILLALFKIWMLVDAVQRQGCRCGNYGIFIIFLPFGDLAYFFVVKIHDPEFMRFRKRLSARLQSLAEVQYKAEHCPSMENKK